MKKLIILIFLFIGPKEECFTLIHTDEAFYFENANHFIITHNQKKEGVNGTIHRIRIESNAICLQYD